MVRREVTTWFPRSAALHGASLEMGSPAELRSVACPNEARGFRLYDERTETLDLPAVSPGPWPGAGL